MMSIIQAIILGLVQGLTEFLPISSSGHLVLFQKLFQLNNSSLAFDVVVHFGTLLAVIVYFWPDIVGILHKPFSRLSILIIFGTIPTAIIGFAFSDYFEAAFHTGKTLGIEFIATGLILWFAEQGRSGRKKLPQTTIPDAILIGTMQGIAILPAISRSGLTIAGSLFRGLDRRFAARFSFLLSIPAILGATALEGKKLVETGLAQEPLVALALGTLAAALSGYLAIRYMLKILDHGSLKVFSYYVFILGAVIILDQLFFNFFFPVLF
ncbi:MAG: undecaprenyl-diphosphate phosphatase [Bacillota bacterium]